MAWPYCAAASARAGLVAPPIAAPPAYHWQVRCTPDGPHAPACMVSVAPTLAVPVIVGTAFVRVPATTVRLLVTDDVASPGAPEYALFSDVGPTGSLAAPAGPHPLPPASELVRTLTDPPV